MILLFANCSVFYPIAEGLEERWMSLFYNIRKARGNMTDRSVQETYAPDNQCFGCGPSNSKGLQIRSFQEGDDFVAEWRAEPHHEAFPGMLNGGIIGALLDCHSNWCAAMHLKQLREEASPPCTVTASFHIKLLKPTPSEATIRLSARVTESSESRAQVEATLEAEGAVCATCTGVFVAVKPGHPAYHRW
jgi:acyl-coenzyme A thioesterase PaaI-like protein